MMHDVKPWTIKGVDPEERNAAISAANRLEMTIGEWLKRAIRTQVQVDRNERRDVAPSVLALPAPPPLAHRPPSSPAAPAAVITLVVNELHGILSLAERLKEATGRPIPRAVTRSVAKHMRALLGP
jgi:hypothetical protein